MLEDEADPTLWFSRSHRNLWVAGDVSSALNSSADVRSPRMNRGQDALGSEPHAWLFGELSAQCQADLLGTPTQLQLGDDELEQHRVLYNLHRPGPCVVGPRPRCGRGRGGTARRVQVTSRLKVDVARPTSCPIAIGPSRGWPNRRSWPARPRIGNGASSDGQRVAPDVARRAPCHPAGTPARRSSTTARRNVSLPLPHTRLAGTSPGPSTPRICGEPLTSAVYPALPEHDALTTRSPSDPDLRFAA